MVTFVMYVFKLAYKNNTKNIFDRKFIQDFNGRYKYVFSHPRTAFLFQYFKGFQIKTIVIHFIILWK